MPKTIFLTLIFTLALTLPVLAQLGKVWTEFQYYSVDLQNYIKNSLSQTIDPLEPQTQKAIINATGVSNIPSPMDAGQIVQEELILNSRADKFENNSVVRSQLATNQLNRLITFSSIAGILGKNGQIRLRNKLQDTEITLKNISAFSQKSDNLMSDLAQLFSSLGEMTSLSPLISAKLSVNQANLQLQNIKIQSELAKITGETLAQTMQLNQSVQYSNLNLANISQQLEESNRNRRLDTANETARLLRATSQLDLLGRKIENQDSKPLK
jgi:hypothetical protein